MGTLIRQMFTIPLPKNAVVKNGVATWKSKGETKAGTVNEAGRVRCVSDTWTAQYSDEAGTIRRFPTKCKDKNLALRILHAKENEVAQVRAGVVDRASLVRSDAIKSTGIIELVKKWRLSILAGGAGEDHADNVVRLATEVIDSTGIDSLKKLGREKVDGWIAAQRSEGVRAPRTINSHVVALKSFIKWCYESDLITKNPLATIKPLNEAVDKRKRRRALTNEEIKELLLAAGTRKRRSNRSPLTSESVPLIYRTLLGTGLRSSELAALKVFQIDLKRNRIDLRPGETKNKKGGFQPLSPELAGRLVTWIDGKAPSDLVFRFDKFSLRSSFQRDCKAAKIELVGADGRSLDVHCLRLTFGTMLARAGVPLTTVQRLMRHSTPELTARLYIDVEEIDINEAIAKLPEF